MHESEVLGNDHSSEQPNEGETSDRPPTLGKGCAFLMVATAATVLSVPIFGPGVVGLYDSIAGNISQNPELVDNGNRLLTIQYVIWGGIFGIPTLAEGIKSMASRLRIQRTPESILITVSKKPITDRN